MGKEIYRDNHGHVYELSQDWEKLTDEQKFNEINIFLSINSRLVYSMVPAPVLEWYIEQRKEILKKWQDDISKGEE